MQTSDFILVIISIAVLFGILACLFKRRGFAHVETEEKKAGRRGEEFATGIIREILRDDDVLLTNRHLLADGMVTELDNVVINASGVFVIEVKNYQGMLDGDEASDQWILTQSVSGGVFRQKMVKNPIAQVNRQIDILERYLRQYGIESPIKGYVFFVQMNSPIKSPHVLETQRHIDKALHTAKKELSDDTKKMIAGLLKGGYVHEGEFRK